MPRAVPYQDPIDHGPLIEEAGGLKNPRNGCLYPLRRKIPVFLPKGSVAGPNARDQTVRPVRAGLRCRDAILRLVGERSGRHQAQGVPRSIAVADQRQFAGDVPQAGTSRNLVNRLQL